jgi:AraC-like DNA-binding protein
VASWSNATTRAEPVGLLRPALARERSSLRREYPVHPALEPFVERYWSVSWDQGERPAFRSEVLSHACVNLAVESGDRPRHGFGLPAALVHGVVTRRFVVDLHGRGRVTAAKFRPGGWTAFSGQRAAPDTVRPGPYPGLVQDVLAVDDDAERVAVLDAALAAHVPAPDPDYAFLSCVIDLVASTRELIRVESVAEAAGTSVRTMQRLFRHYVGVGPKWVLARHRLQDAAAAIDAGEVEDLAQLATDLGWFDQAHFSRDFRAVVGVTPSSYLAAARAASRA